MIKIALPITETNFLDDHFGHCESFQIYTITGNNEIADVETIRSMQGCGCKSGIAETLSDKGVNKMLVGGIGAGAINVLNNRGIQVVSGCAGKSDEVIKQYLDGMITDNGTSCVQHDKHHRNGHQCNH